jgi:hypothetical protein
MKRAFLFAAAAILLAALAIYWLGQQRAAARRLAEWEAERDDHIAPVLTKTFEWEWSKLTLRQFADLIEERCGVPVEIDEPAIRAEGGINPEKHQITILGGEAALNDVLQAALELRRLSWDARGTKLVITTWANSDRRRERTVVYPVPHSQSAGLSESDWEQLVQANIDGHAHRVPGAIIVVANRDNHLRTRMVIEAISALREPAAKAIPIPMHFSDMELRIRAELEREASVDFVEQPLKDVAIYLSDRHDIPVILAADKLQEASVDFNTPITKTLRGISLHSALRLILKDLELSYIIRDQALVITTPEDAERERTVAYAVDDLSDMPGVGVDAESLAELIEACIAPDQWGAHSGPPTIRHAGDKWLVFEQTDAVHEQVGALLATLRQMLAVEGHGSSQPIEPFGNMERHIRTALEQPIELEFNSMPLKDAVLYLSESQKIPIILSAKKLEEAAIYPGTPVTFKTASVSMRTALERMLTPAKLDFVVRDEVLQITTPEDSESHLVTRVYDARAVLQTIPEQHLRNFVMDNVQPRSWDNTGGPGQADLFRGLLVVSHTDRAHEEVERLVEKLTAELQEAK